ncbi:META domain-containing protein [Timonella sp. A28]|uniref:META domain-containing protein n=1 Tax=Timonella sp. A28 TaxID=3442640 RepID=UPI003EBAFAB4
MNDLTTHHWTVTAIDGEPVFEQFAPTLEFDATGRISGSTGVNTFFGAYFFDGATVKVETLGSTRKTGPAQAVLQEHRFLSVLQGERPVTYAEGILTIGTTETGVIEAAAVVSSSGEPSMLR